MEATVEQEQKQVQWLSTSMRQSLEILQMSSRDLMSLVKKELLKNPVIEWNGALGSKKEQEAHEAFLEALPEKNVPIKDYIEAQVPEWGPEKKLALGSLLESLNERGFLEMPLEKVAKTSPVSLAVLKEVYQELLTLKPYGIGARDLKEALWIQLSHQENTPEIELEKRAIKESFDDLMAGNIDKVARQLNCSKDQVYALGKAIVRLNFSPLSGFSQDVTPTVLPDLRIIKEHGEWKVEFNEDSVPHLRMSRHYKEWVGDVQQSTQTIRYLKHQAVHAKNLMQAIDRRRATLLAIGVAIANAQKDFLEYGKDALSPLRLKDVAQVIQVNTSTVCRAIRCKYVETPHGIMPMGDFFSTGKTSGLARSAIKERIKNLIIQHKGHLSDSAITKQLEDNGIVIARRTVAKYRQELGLPSSRSFSKKSAQKD